jgi:hypothetical protein
VPDSIEGLGHVEKDTPAVLPPLKGGRNGIHNAKALLDCGMERPKAKLVVWDGFSLSKDRKDTFEEEFFKHF